MSKRKRNRELRKGLESNADYLQTNPEGGSLSGDNSSRQNPRNLPTENASLKDNMSNRIQKEAQRDQQQKKLEGGERGE